MLAMNKKNADKLILKNKNLEIMPLLEGEENLKLLNLQGNKIKKIENLVSLPSLLYLDLFDNQITEIGELTKVSTLKMLMIGKNLIKRIKGLETLNKLNGLDLHSNQI